MDSTISNIGTKISTIFKEEIVVSEEEKINEFLDSLLSLKHYLISQTKTLSTLDELFAQLTWHDIQNEEEEIFLKQIIEEGKAIAKKLVPHLEYAKQTFKEKIYQTELSNFDNALEDFEDTVFEVEEIFFVIRKDKKLNDLMNSHITINSKIHTPKQIQFLQYMKEKEAYMYEIMTGNDTEEVEKKYNREFITPIQLDKKGK